MKSLNNLLRVLLVLSLVLSACGPLANEASTPTSAPDSVETRSAGPTVTAVTASPAATVTQDTEQTPPDDAREAHVAPSPTRQPTDESEASATPSQQTSSDSSVSAVDTPPTFTPAPRPTIPRNLPAIEMARNEALDRLDEFMFLVEDLRAEIDRTQFDLNELSFALDVDAEPRVAFVRDEIAFEQYRGTLRGAQGTLMSRAGNTLDQAILLATLLGDAGYQTRIVRGELAESPARDLVHQMGEPREPAPPLGDEEAIEEVLAEMAAVYGGEVAAQVEGVALAETSAYQNAQTAADDLLTELNAAGVDLGDPDAEAALVAEARDYFWIEYKLGPSDPWEQAHPAFADTDAAPDDLAAQEYFGDSIPEELQHRVRIEFGIESKLGDTVREQVIMEPWERPAANMAGVVLTLSNYPNGISPETRVANIEGALADTNVFIPMFNGEPAPGAVAFDLNGMPLDLEAMGMDTFGATALFQTVGGMFEDAAGALGGLDSDEEENPEDLVTLTGQWVDYTLIAPGGEETTYRRYVLDRVGAANRAAGSTAISVDMTEPEMARTLLSQQSIMVAPGRYPRAYVVDRYLQRLSESEDLLAAIIERGYDPDAEIPVDAVGVETPMKHLMLYTLFDAGADARADTTSYYPEPALVVFGDGFVTAERAVASVDIVNNTRRIFRGDGNRITTAPSTAVQQGVWETKAEQLALAESQGAHINAFVAFENAAEAGIGTRVITPQDAGAVNSLQVSGRARANLRRDLVAGYVVVVPEETPPNVAMAGWWRVDPETGETLGVTGDGRGQDATEYVIQITDISLTLIFVLKTLNECAAEASTSAQMCCLMKGFFSNAVGLSLGGVLGATFGGAAALTFNITSNTILPPDYSRICEVLDPSPLDDF